MNMKRLVIVLAVALLSLAGVAESARSQNRAQEGLRIVLPNKKDSVHFAVIGDTGSGTEVQQQVAEVLYQSRELFPFDFALLLGDNLYGGEGVKDYSKKFEMPYKRLLDAGVKFYAALGNHDRATQRYYKNFNMDGREYYTFKRGNVRFFALNSNYLDKPQLKWFEEELSKSGSDWKIAYFHHPLYSSGKQHGSNEELQKVLEPLFIKYGVSVVFAGHEHFYERIKPQKGVYHFISGGGGKLREGDVRRTDLTERSFDQDLHFMLIEIAGDEMHFQAISRTGKTVDSGIIRRQVRG